jgi:hypothetical protein
MDGMKAMERLQDSQRQVSQRQVSQHKDSQRQRTDLDHRYRKIGISAVAAAVRHQGEQHNAARCRIFPYDRD